MARESQWPGKASGLSEGQLPWKASGLFTTSIVFPSAAAAALARTGSRRCRTGVGGKVLRSDLDAIRLKRTSVHKCMRTCMYACCTCTNKHICMCTCMHAYMHMYMYVCIVHLLCAKIRPTKCDGKRQHQQINKLHARVKFFFYIYLKVTYQA